MKIKIYKCDYCHKDTRHLRHLFKFDACQKCYNDFWYSLEDELSDILKDFLQLSKYSSSVLNRRCEKCGADWETAEYIETIKKRDVTAFSVPNITLSVRADVCKKCSDIIYKQFLETASEILTRFRVKHKKKDVAKLTYINELFQFSKEQK
jgi:hypothetical protein